MIAGRAIPRKIGGITGRIMKKSIVCGVLAAALFSAPALAADLPKGPVYKAAPAPVFNWTGFYGGVNAGYAWDPNYVFNSPADAFTVVLPLELQGGFGGVQLGYNWHYARNWLFGIEADFQFASLKDTAIFSVQTPGDSFASLAIQHFATLRGRFAYVQDRNLFYVTGGAAIANFKANVLADFDTGDGIINGNKWLGGYVVGLGFERAFGNNWSLKFEYLYIDFAHLNLTGVRVPTGEQVTLSGDPYMHLVRLGLNLRFSSGMP